MPLLEANDIRIVALPTDCGDVGALFTRQSGTPFVFLPSRLDGEQARRHLPHELGQRVLGHSRPGHRVSRTAAVPSASAFLMPRTAVVASTLRTATLERLAAEAGDWGVSISAVLHRLHELELSPSGPTDPPTKDSVAKRPPTSRPEPVPMNAAACCPKPWLTFEPAGFPSTPSRS
ncbi:ImmA/IrrE family metallo-endopeptidase [Streptomyces sp. cg35]|uniref:ImmA/IrrE family metallo-endopeptidase n=1 Tax=Streptomyces sp. cg35 TaxID=3421650 RepID=UPI003D173AA9